MDSELPVKIFTATLGLMILVFLGSILALGIKSVTASDEVEFCYIRKDGYPDVPSYTMYGSIPWREDRHIQRAATIAELVESAKQMECEIR